MTISRIVAIIPAMFTKLAKQSTEQAIQRVRAFRNRKRLKLNTFAKAVGVNESTLRNMDDPDWRPEIETLEKLEAYVAAAEQEAAQ